MAWLNEQPALVLISSVLVEIELARALRRYDPAALSRVPGVLARLVRVELDAAVRAIAAALEHDGLRSLDAIHLATAQYLSSTGDSPLAGFVAYDARLLGFAQMEGLEALMPV